MIPYFDLFAKLIHKDGLAGILKDDLLAAVK
jgi:hypothetical protein